MAPHQTPQKTLRGLRASAVEVIFLDQSAEGAEVEVRLVEGTLSREEAIARVLANPIRRPVGIDEIIAECKQEHEERHRAMLSGRLPAPPGRLPTDADPCRRRSVRAPLRSNWPRTRARTCAGTSSAMSRS